MSSRILAIIVVVVVVVAQPCGAHIVYSSITEAPYEQDFNSLTTSGSAQTWTNDSTLTGWHLFRQPSPGTAISSYNAHAGQNNTGGFYSFGTGTNSDRALGGLGSGGTYFGSPASGAIAGWIAMSVQNSTGSTIESLTLSFTGEQWRNGGNTSAQPMTLQYGFGSTFTGVGTWNTPGANFNWSSPINTASASALDGNLAANRVTGRGGTIPSLTWTNGQVLWMRWAELNDTSNDHGLAIDDLSFTAKVAAVPEPAAYLFGGLVCGILSLAAATRWRWGKRRASGGE